uniref:Uncharacterized protein n=1 Tax=viral metagenome TaxID=1070528 RepID=A0A6M3JQ74_9ZZZZ
MARKKPKKWIQGLKKGTLTAAAKSKGVSISEYCDQKDLSPLAKKR